MKAAHEFVKGGGAGADYALCPCLNDHDAWIQTMVELVKAASPTKP